MNLAHEDKAGLCQRGSYREQRVQVSKNHDKERGLKIREISGEKISSRGWRSEESLELSVRAERPKNIEQRLEEQGEP